MSLSTGLQYLLQNKSFVLACVDIKFDLCRKGSCARAVSLRHWEELGNTLNVRSVPES